MKQIVSCAAAVAALFVSFATGAKTLNADAAASGLLLDVTKTPSNQLIAVGERGHIVRQEQQQWQLENSPVTALLTRITSDGKAMWAIGHDGVILKREPQGWQLKRQDIEGEQPLMDLLFLSDNEAIAIGAYGEFLRSLDGGESWQEEMHEGLLYEEDRDYLAELKLEATAEDYDYELSTMLPHLNRVIALSNGDLLMVGELGLVALSNDQGRNWRRVDIGYEGSFFAAISVLHNNNQRLVIGGLRGNLFYSDDQGLSWQQSKNDVKSTVNGFVYQPSVGLVALASNGRYLLSGDQGESFVSKRLQRGETAVSGVVVDSSIYIAGDRGIRQLAQ